MTNPSETKVRFFPVFLLQGAYYIVTGLWPIVSMTTFEAVTGPKTDHWLVKTVGALVSVVGFSFFCAARGASPTAQAVLLALGCAGALTAIDIIYVLLGTINPVYLVDAVIEVLLILYVLASARSNGPALPPPANPF